MRRFPKWFFMFLTLFVVLLILPNLVHAQIDPGGDPDAPIDGGLSILLAAGVGYGVKKYRDHKKSNSEAGKGH